MLSLLGLFVGDMQELAPQQQPEAHPKPPGQDEAEDATLGECHTPQRSRAWS
jgi:hypothetical protein